MRQLLAQTILAAVLPCLTGASMLLGQNVAQYLPLIGASRGAGAGAGAGAAFTLQCPADHAVTGVRARLGRVVEAIGIRCRPVAPNGSLGEERDVGGMSGATSGSVTTGSCPAGSVIVGQAGTVNSHGIAQLSLRCRRWDAATRSWGGATTALIQLLAGAAPAVVVGALQGNAAQNSVDCSRQTQPAILLRGRAATIVEAVGVTCDEP